MGKGGFAGKPGRRFFGKEVWPGRAEHGGDAVEFLGIAW